MYKNWSFIIKLRTFVLFKCTCIQLTCGDCGVGLQTVLHSITVVGHTVHSVGCVWEESSELGVLSSDICVELRHPIPALHFRDIAQVVHSWVIEVVPEDDRICWDGCDVHVAYNCM